MYQGARDSDGRNVPESRVLSDQQGALHTPLKVQCIFSAFSVHYMFYYELCVHEYLHQGIVRPAGGSLHSTQSALCCRAFAMHYQCNVVQWAVNAKYYMYISTCIRVFSNSRGDPHPFKVHLQYKVFNLQCKKVPFQCNVVHCAVICDISHSALTVSTTSI